MDDDWDETVLLSRAGGVCTITLNRPEKRNAAGGEMQRLILARLKEAGADPDTRALVLTGAGPSFCGGADRALMIAAGEGRLPDADDYNRLQHEMARTVLEHPFPAIAAVNGAAAGFGATLAAICDIVVVGEDAAFWDPHVEYGFPASAILQTIWARQAPLAVVKEILMTGRRVGAAEAVALGLATRLCPAGQALPAAMELAETFARLPASGVTAMKRRLNRAALAELFEA